MQKEIAKGPIVVALEADLPSFQNYGSGIYNDERCGSNVDQYAVIVGYGTEQSTG